MQRHQQRSLQKTQAQHQIDVKGRRQGIALIERLLDGASGLAQFRVVEGYANQALRLLPEWTQWCIEQSGLNADAAARSHEAARSAASALIDDEDDEPAPEEDEAPFRRHE